MKRPLALLALLAVTTHIALPAQVARAETPAARAPMPMYESTFQVGCSAFLVNSLGNRIAAHSSWVGVKALTCTKAARFCPYPQNHLTDVRDRAMAKCEESAHKTFAKLCAKGPQGVTTVTVGGKLKEPHAGELVDVPPVTKTVAKCGTALPRTDEGPPPDAETPKSGAPNHHAGTPEHGVVPPAGSAPVAPSGTPAPPVRAVPAGSSSPPGVPTAGGGAPPPPPPPPAGGGGGGGGQRRGSRKH